MPASKTKELSEEDRSRVVSAVLSVSTDGKPAWGALALVADEFDVDPSTISRIWRRARDEFASSGSYASKSQKNRRGRPKKDYRANLESLRGVDMLKRSTVRSSAAACGVPRSTLHRRINDGDLTPHTSVLKPLLTEANMASRLAWCKQHLDPRTLLYDDMMTTIHVDEKLFNLTKVKRRFYLLPGEEPPKRHAKSKRHIGHVMFLAAVARPRRDLATGELFDGKLGVWPFVVKRAATRSSVRRPAGTIETKTVNVSKTTYRQMLIEKLLPAVTETWPWAMDESLRIIIQQDNASPHIPTSDPRFLAAVDQCGRSIELVFQPPNSPDLNVLDLGLFTAIQSRQEQQLTRDFDELIAAVEAAYWELPPSTINAAFLSLQTTMDKCIEDKGGNNFKPVHLGKAHLEKEGRLPLSIRCSSRAAEVLSLS